MHFSKNDYCHDLLYNIPHGKSHVPTAHVMLSVTSWIGPILLNWSDSLDQSVPSRSVWSCQLQSTFLSILISILTSWWLYRVPLWKNPPQRSLLQRSYAHPVSPEVWPFLALFWKALFHFSFSEHWTFRDQCWGLTTLLLIPQLLTLLYQTIHVWFPICRTVPQLLIVTQMWQYKRYLKALYRSYNFVAGQAFPWQPVTNFSSAATTQAIGCISCSLLR